MVRGAPGDVWALGVTMLYVLGRIHLPERTVQGWRISEARDNKSQAFRQMLAWLESVTRVRAELDRADRFEGLVHRMLEWAPESRVQAGQASALLESPA